MSTSWLEIVWLGAANAAMAFTVAETKLFAPWRQWVKARSAFCGELFGCGYCLGHWTAFALTALHRPRLFECWWPLDYFLTALVVAWLSAFQWIVLCWLMQKTGK